ncbi:ASPH [Symbiodinium natans]|uniref:ASPH protein n=1 Tax=Symbiodinium natans TaxID=878477 RepID=A0A812GJR1_9DINO|nr:ASPH [Symbiodinium natans]
MAHHPPSQVSPRLACLALGVLAVGRFIGDDAFSMARRAPPVRDLRSLKEDLGRRMPSEATIAALEGIRPKRIVSSMRDLQGTWHATTPEDDSPPRFEGFPMHGDVPRMLLSLYAGDMGRMLNMEVVAAPVLHITGDGRTSTATKLRWGQQQDEITLQGRLELIGSNLLREMPQTMRSDALKLTLPALQKRREVRITYFDGTLLILRDARGVVDMLWREEEPEMDNMQVQRAGSARAGHKAKKVDRSAWEAARLERALGRNERRYDLLNRRLQWVTSNFLEAEATKTSGSWHVASLKRAFERMGRRNDLLQRRLEWLVSNSPKVNTRVAPLERALRRMDQQKDLLQRRLQWHVGSSPKARKSDRDAKWHAKSLERALGRMDRRNNLLQRRMSWVLGNEQARKNNRNIAATLPGEGSWHMESLERALGRNERRNELLKRRLQWLAGNFPEAEFATGKSVAKSPSTSVFGSGTSGRQSLTRTTRSLSKAWTRPWTKRRTKLSEAISRLEGALDAVRTSTQAKGHRSRAQDVEAALHGELANLRSELKDLEQHEVRSSEMAKEPKIRVAKQAKKSKSKRGLWALPAWLGSGE